MHQKYSRSFITLQLNHWCHMDYFNNVLPILGGLERVNYLAVRVRKYFFIKNILICVPKMIEGLMTEFSFLG